ncbi:MAG: hypothetical protein QOC87_2210, partial [Actinomycetota bacterium]|nr:hypothetical protein [Actinomycetota bacterium]
MSPRLRLIAPLVLLALVATALSAPAVQAAHRSASKHKVGFSTPTVVDNFRPGFEPDLGVDVSPKGKDTTYVSYPFGFSTTQSIIYRSDDHRKSFHLIEGNVDGKPGSCAGGGDSEIKIDPISGDMYFVDLQGLTNFSASTSTDKGATFSTSCNSVNGVAVDRQWLGIDTNGGKSAVAAGADGGRLYLDYDNVGQDTGNGGNNQLVMNESLDGVHYGSGCQAAGAPCPGVPAVASPDEGIPGNIVVDNQPANQGDAFVHRVYAIHTNSSSSGVIVSYCSGAPGDDTAAKVAASCTDPTQVTADPSHVNIYWHDSFVRPAGSYGTGYLFAAMAVDSAGNLYAVWSEYPQSGGSPSGPGIVKLAVSTDGAKTWSDPIDVSPPTLGNNVMPWVAAGDPGRIDIAWYGAPQAKGPSGDFGPDTLDQGTWNVYMAQSLNALAAQPKFKLTKVTDHQTKFGNISTQGLGGSPDRSLGDFMQVQVGKKGQAILSYVDDTSADRNPDFCGGCGQTPAEAAGPIMIATQNRGASLFNSVRKVTGPKRAVNKVRDKKGDGAFYGGGTSMPATPSMDLRGASIKMAGAKHIKVTLKTADKTLANDLMVDPSLGGTVGEWLVRWAAPVYKGKPGDGNIFYTGM